MSNRSPISVCVVEDNRGTREGLVATMERVPSLRCVATYRTAEAALEDIPLKKPDVALVDINLPGVDGIELMARLKLRVPELLVLILTNYEDSRLIFDALRAGASGYLLKREIPEGLVPAIEAVQAGGAPMSMPVARKVVEYFRQVELRAEASAAEVQKLTAREQEILALLAKGCLIKEIGDQLGIAYHTVRTHVRNIYGKLHVQSRSEAMLRYLGRGPAR